MRKVFAILAAVMLIAVAAGCGNTNQTSESSQGKKLQPLTIGVMPDTDSIPFIIAQEKGYFAEEGLNVTVQQFKSAMDRDSALQSGNLDGDISDMLAVGFAEAGGFDVRVTSFTDGNYRLVASQASGINKVQNLAGQDVAVSKNTIIDYVTDRILAQEHMTPDSINKVIIPQIPTRLEMLQNGKLAAATLPEPMASIAVHNGCTLITDSESMGINPGVMVFTKKATANKAESIKALYRAYNKAVDYLNNTPREEYIDLVIEKSGFPEAAKEALQLPKYRHADLPKQSDVDDCMTWLHDKGLIDKVYSYDDIVVDLLN